MSDNGFLLEVYRDIKKYIPDKYLKCFLAGVVIIALCVLLYSFLNSNYYAERWRRPVWDYQEKEGCDIVKSDIELKAGDIVMTPQIVIKYDRDIVFIINIVSYYDKNTADLIEDSDGEARQFELLIEDSQRQKLDELFMQIQKEVKAQVGEVEPDKVAKLTFKATKVAKVHSQNLKASEDRTQYVYFADAKESDLLVEDAEMRKSRYHIDLDNYSKQLQEIIITACVEKILELE